MDDPQPLLARHLFPWFALGPALFMNGRTRDLAEMLNGRVVHSRRFGFRLLAHALIGVGALGCRLGQALLACFQRFYRIIRAAHPAPTEHVALLLLVLDGKVLQNRIFPAFGSTFRAVEHQRIFAKDKWATAGTELRMIGLPFAPLF